MAEKRKIQDDVNAALAVDPFKSNDGPRLADETVAYGSRRKSKIRRPKVTIFMLLCVGDCQKCVFLFGLRKKRACVSPYRPKDYLAASGYTICDDGRRQAGAYFSAQARNKRTTQRTQKRDGQKVTNFICAKAGGRTKCMF